jgi:hypothetical protein
MADTVGSLMVEAGMNLAGFEESVKQIPAITSKHMERMSAEMKRTTREGAESLRLIDEALGVHLSRPLTRIIAQIPGVGTALQGLLGGAAFGAFAVAGTEFFDKMVEKIEKAQKTQEELASSSEKAKQTFAGLMGELDKSATLRGLSGLDRQLKELDYSALERASKGIGELSAANEKQAKDTEAASGAWTHFLAAIGTTWSGLTGSAGVEGASKQFEEFNNKIKDIKATSQSNPLQGLREALAATQEEAKKAAQMLAAMEAMKMSGPERALNSLSMLTGGPAKIGFSQAAIDMQQKYLDNLKEIATYGSGLVGDNQAAENEAKKADAMERQVKAAEALTSLQKDIGGGMGRLVPEIDPIKRMQTEIAGLKMSAENAFADMESSGGATKWQKAFGLDHLDEYKQKLDEFFQKFKQDTEIAQSLAKLPSIGDLMGDQAKALSSISGNDLAGQPNYLEKAVPGSSLNLPAATPQAPMLGAGGLAQQQMDAFATDASAKMALVKKAEEDATTPLQKYVESVARLNIAFQGITDTSLLAAKTQALAIALKEYTQATVKAGEGTLKLQKQLDDLEKHSDSAIAGIAAAMTQLEMNTSFGKFGADLANTAISGFEDQTIKMLEGSKAHWSEYFKSIETMALKFAMNKAITAALAPVTKAIEHKLGINPTGKSHDAVEMANTVAIVALTAAIKASSLGGGGGGGGGGAQSADAAGDAGTANFSDLIPHAAGGDVTPGQGYLVGENGPEPFFPGVSGSIAPHSSLSKGGGEIHNHYYDFADFKGDASLMSAVTAMVEKRGQQAEQRAVVQNNERSLRTTSGH